MQTVVETSAFIRAAAHAGMTAAEITAVVNYLAENPDAGDEMRGTGGCRKIRFAKPGKGKSGGYRVVTFFSGPAIPVFLITIFSKNEKANLTDSEANALRDLTKVLLASYRRPRR